MRRPLLMMATLLAVAHLAACTCAERTTEAEDPPISERSIEAVCESYCSELMECVYDDLTVEFDSEEGCRNNCVNDVQWSRGCAAKQFDAFECVVQYQCPEFAEAWTDVQNSPCAARLREYSSCLGSPDAAE